MKRRVITLFAGALAASMILAGCSASKGLETDKLAISNYKSVEIDKVEKPGEVTDEDVENNIQASLQMNAAQEDVTGRAVESGRYGYAGLCRQD